MEGNKYDEKIIAGVFNAGWDGAMTAQDYAADAATKAWKTGAKHGRRKGFVVGVLATLVAASLGVAYEKGVFPFKKKSADDLDNFEVNDDPFDEE